VPPALALRSRSAIGRPGARLSVGPTPAALGFSNGELIQEMNVDPSILVTPFNPLEAGGLVSRERDPADRRRHLVT
jgi:DNA-binding MarR family transcriptional regulator